MIFYDNQDKTRLGFIIEYKRSSLNRQDSLAINRFLMDEEGKQICDFKTYQKLQAGLPIRNDDVYDLLLEKFGYSATDIFASLNIVDQLGRDLIAPVNSMNETAIKLSCLQAERDLKQIKNILLVEDFIKLITTIKKGYLEDKFISEFEFHELSNGLKFMKKDMQALFLHLMYQYVAHLKRGIKEINEFVEENKIKDFNEIFLRIDYCEYLLLNRKRFEALEGFERVLAKAEHENNIACILLMQMEMFNLMDGISNQHYHHYYDEILNMLKKHKDKISMSTKNRLFYGLGMYFYQNEYYKEAFTYLAHCYKNNIDKYFFCYIYCNYMNRKKLIKKLVFNDSYISPIHTQNGIYYEYYRQVALKKSEKTLKHFLLKNIKKTMSESSDYYPIFTGEMVKLCDSSEDYCSIRKWLE